ncbi:unnamed protein product [Euphydryas editha]|uniref:Secreted protein n=1 Tax=Euphydryas editha TaxID=104508 RepID=A0AAU9U1A4_EUPED|nr:unnamed protein product [Euphydryas editha]
MYNTVIFMSNSPCACSLLATALERIASTSSVRARDSAERAQCGSGGRRDRTPVLQDEYRSVRREERGVSRERSTGHCVHVLRRTATAGKAIFTRETR